MKLLEMEKRRFGEAMQMKQKMLENKERIS